MFRGIKTERLLVRRFQRWDGRACLRMLSSSDVMRYIPEEPYSILDVQRLIASARREVFPSRLAVSLRPGVTLVGALMLAPARKQPATRELGYIIAPGYQGRGFATEAVTAVLDYGFRELNLERVIACCTAENTASIRILEKVGFQLTETVSRTNQKTGEKYDECKYELLPRKQGNRPYMERR